MFSFTKYRPDWVESSYPVVGPDFPNWNDIDSIVIHYTGMPEVPDGDPGETQAQVAQLIRAVQRNYTNKRGYSIGYNVWIDMWGASWQVRGFEFRNAANKGNITKNHHSTSTTHNCNHHSLSVLLLVDSQDKATTAAIDELNRLRYWLYAETGKVLKVVGHRDYDYTDCPGDGVYSQIPNLGSGIPPQGNLPNMSKFKIHDPVRILDTRSGTDWAANNRKTPFKANEIDTLKPHAYTPADADGVILSITTLNNDGPGFFTFFKSGSNPPNASSINKNPSALSNNMVWVPMGAFNTFRLFSSHGGHIIIDQIGFYQEGSW